MGDSLLIGFFNVFWRGREGKIMFRKKLVSV